MKSFCGYLTLCFAQGRRTPQNAKWPLFSNWWREDCSRCLTPPSEVTANLFVPFSPTGCFVEKGNNSRKILLNISLPAIFFLLLFFFFSRSKLLICSWNSSVVAHSSFNHACNLSLCHAFGHERLWSTKIALWALRWSSKVTHEIKTKSRLL